MRERDILKIGDIYGSMLNSVKTIKESKQPKTFDGEFRSKKQKDGPENADGYNKAENEPGNEEDEEDGVSKYLPKRQKTAKTLEDKLKDPNISEKSKKNIKNQLRSRQAEEAEEYYDDRDDDYSEQEWESKFRKDKGDKWDSREIDDAIEDERKKKYDEDEEILESKKIATQILNKHMSKSAFDKLFNKVLKENFGQPQEGDDLDALGLDDSTPDADMGDDFGGDEDFGDEEDSVTFTLDRATAQTLIDVLQGALGGEDEGEGEDELDFGDEGGEDDGMDFEEDEEFQGTKPAPDKKDAFQAKSNKVGGKANPKGSKTAKTDVTDDIGTKTTTPSFAALQGKSNQVPGSTLKAKQDYFR